MLTINYNLIKKTIFNKQKGFWRVAALSKLKNDKDKKNEIGNKLIRDKITIQDKKLKKYSFLSIITEKKPKNNKIIVNTQTQSINKHCDNNNCFLTTTNNFTYFTPKNNSNYLNIEFSKININLFPVMYKHDRNETEKIYTIKSLEKEFEQQYKKYKMSNNKIYINTDINNPKKTKYKLSRKSSLKKPNKILNLVWNNECCDKNFIKPKSALKLKKRQPYITINEVNKNNFIDTKKILINNNFLLKNSKSESDFTVTKKFEKFNKKLEIYTKYKELMKNTKQAQDNLKSGRNLYKLSNMLKIRKIRFNDFGLNQLNNVNSKKIENLKRKAAVQKTIFPFRNNDLPKVFQSNYGTDYANFYNSSNSFRQTSKNISNTDKFDKLEKNKMSFYCGNNNKNSEMKEREFFFVSNSIRQKKKRINILNMHKI